MRLNWFLIVPMIVLAAYGIYQFVSADTVLSKVVGGLLFIAACATAVAHIVEKRRRRVKDADEHEK